MNRLFLGCLLASISLLSEVASSGEGTVRETRSVESVGFGANFNLAVESALGNAIRQVTGVSLEESRRTKTESVDSNAGQSSFTETTTEDTATQSRGRIVGYDVLEAGPAEDGGMTVRIRATVRTPEGLKYEFDTLMKKGEQLFRERKYADSLAVFEQALKVPGYEDVIQAQQWMTHVRKAKENADRYMALMNDGIARFNIREYAEAETAFKETIRIFPNDPLAKQWLDKTQMILADANHHSMSMEEGKRLYQNGKYAEAKAAFEQARRIRDDMDVRRWLERTEDELRRVAQMQAQCLAWAGKIRNLIKEGDSAKNLKESLNWYSEARREAASALAMYPNDQSIRALRQDADEKYMRAENQQEKSNAQKEQVKSQMIRGAGNALGGLIRSR